MSFSFDFSGDDIEDDEQLTSEVTNRTGALKLEGKNDVNATSSSSSSAVETAAMEEAKPRRENVKEFVSFSFSFSSFYVGFFSVEGQCVE